MTLIRQERFLVFIKQMKAKYSKIEIIIAPRCVFVTFREKDYTSHKIIKQRVCDESQI